MNHPCQYTPIILEKIESIIGDDRTPIHDPFAGTGIRLGKLCDTLNITFTGTDIEDWPGKDPRVRIGDSALIETYPAGPYTIITSPTYQNKRLADYKNGPTPNTNPKGRRDYGISLGRALHPNNTARWTGNDRFASEYWERHREIAKTWETYRVILNVDFPIAHEWAVLLHDAGWPVQDHHIVKTPRYRGLSNDTIRAQYELIIDASRRGVLENE